MALLSAGAAFLPPGLLPAALLLLPVIGVVVGLLLPRRMRGKTWGLAVSASTFFTALSMALQYDWAKGGYQFKLEGPGIDFLNAKFVLAVDQISLMLVLLAAALHPLAVTASLRSIHIRPRQHYAWMNALLIMMMGVFMAGDLLLFYVFFEASLVPLFFIIGIWGSTNRRQAAARYFLMTFAASVFALAGILYLGLRAKTFNLADVTLFAQTMSNTERFWVLLSFLAAFGVKSPLFPLHTWLPLAHTEAPTAGSVDLAALVLKLGTYGLLRIALPIGLIGPDGTVLFPVVLSTLGVICLIGIVYGALVAGAQNDAKKLVAYSSVSHIGFCVLGMLALNPEGMAGSVLYMINHGIISGALFLIVGMIYNRYHTRDLRELSGLGKAMPKLSFFMIFFTMAAIGLPGLNGFVSEFLTILGAFTSGHLGMGYGIVAATGIVLGAIYMLKMASGLFFGPLVYPVLMEGHDSHSTVHPHYVMGGDITKREVLVLAPLALAALVLGVFPGPALKALERPLADIRTGQITAGLSDKATVKPVAAAHQAMRPVASTPVK